MDRCIVRRAIKVAETGMILGYHLDIPEQEDESTDVVMDFLLNNSNKFISEKITFVPFPTEPILRKTIQLFEPGKIVINLGGQIEVTDSLVALVEELYDAGYLFATRVTEYEQEHMCLNSYIDYIWIDSRSSRELRLIRDLHLVNKKCIACEIETKELYEAAVETGADYLEGNFIASTLVTKVDKVEFLQGNFYQFMLEVMSDEPRMSVLEGIVKRDAGLTYALLRMVNSAYFALRKRTDSVLQALVTIGLRKLQQWSYMMSFKLSSNGQAAEEILKLSFIRAKYAAELVHYIKGCKVSANDAYLIGMFSAMEYMVEGDFEEILSGIPLNQDVSMGLIEREGMPGNIYYLVLAYERSNWEECKKRAGELGVPVYLLAQTYLNCIESVNNIWSTLMVEYSR
ncbi:c-di-GMP-related signal transduction protein [Lachnospiraceae bacterium PF1-21]|nr:HDOD domain-containing protein [Lachnospiraceae bacterium OttesenSCG-928-J05]